MAQILDSEPLLTPKKIETWATTKLDTCSVPMLPIHNDNIGYDYKDLKKDFLPLFNSL